MLIIVVCSARYIVIKKHIFFLVRCFIITSIQIPLTRITATAHKDLMRLFFKEEIDIAEIEV